MKEPVHLRMNLFFTNVGGHPQEAMKRLGITYEHATPKIICDQWWFWACRNLPDKLPSYLEELGLTPDEAVGVGLSREDAARINAAMEKP